MKSLDVRISKLEQSNGADMNVVDAIVQARNGEPMTQADVDEARKLANESRNRHERDFFNRIADGRERALCSKEAV
jgi:hypothetical protein